MAEEMTSKALETPRADGEAVSTLGAHGPGVYTRTVTERAQRRGALKR